MTEKSCGAVVFKKDNGKILYVIICSKEGFYGFPKGHVEIGEGEWETAAREIKEETGLTVSRVGDFRTEDEHRYVRRDGSTAIKRIVYFLAQFSAGNISVQRSELSDARLMSFEEAMSSFQFESSKRILTEAREALKNYNII